MPDKTGGPCPDCNTQNPYTGYRCVTCGHRLPWADTYAATSGEPCPSCGTFNPYLNAICKSCQAQLPWWDAPATRRHNSGQAEKDQKSMLVTFIVCGIIGMGFLLFLMIPWYGHGS